MASIINATTSTGLVSSADNSGSLQLATNNGTTAVTIDTSQNVGIGTASPTSKLTVRTADGDGVSIQNAAGTAYRWAVNADNSFSCVNTGIAERMRIDSSGNVGIGTSSPLVTSANRKVVTLNGTTDAMYNIGINGTYTGFFYSSASNTQIGSATSIPLQFYTGDTERMRITSGGNLAVGTTSLANASARAAIVNSGGGSIVMQIQRSGENASYIGSDNADIFSVWDSAPVKRFAVTSGGSCQNTTGSYGTISDIKLKENIVDATPKLEKVMQLQVKNYNLKSNPEFKQIGFIAQELKEVFPSLIEETPDEDENGEKIGEVTLGVKTSVLIPILVKALQELNAKVDAQAVRIAELEGAK